MADITQGPRTQNASNEEPTRTRNGGDDEEEELEDQQGEDGELRPETEAQELRRLRAEMKRLEREEELYDLRARVARAKRLREAGYPPGVEPTPLSSSKSSTVSDVGGTRAVPHRGGPHPRLKQPEVFKARTVKEADNFL